MYSALQNLDVEEPNIAKVVVAKVIVAIVEAVVVGSRKVRENKKTTHNHNTTTWRRVSEAVTPSLYVWCW